jgi:hypothetical protein
MEQQETQNTSGAIARLIPLEAFGPDLQALSPDAPLDNTLGYGDVVCAGLEDLSRHLKRLEDEYQSGQLDRLEVCARRIVMLADQLGLRRVGQVAADVIYCIDDPDEVALSATLSRLIRLMTQALDQAAGPTSAF